MWAGGHQQPSANAQQWWQMSYNYQYHTQSADSSQDWAAKAALWAQQRMAQEQMAQYYQQLPPADQQQPALYGGYKVEQPVGVAQQPAVSAESQQHYYQPAVPEEVPPPLPPETESEPPIPGWQAQDNHQVTDNMETIAMDDEAAENNSSQIEADKGQPSAPHGEEMGQTAFMQDYNHQPPPALPGMQTFDHNHGFRRPIPQHYVSSAAAQPIDYGHQSLDYHHEAPLVPDTQVYDYQAPYDNQYYHQMPYEMERSHPKLAPEPFKSKPPPSADFPPELSGLSDVKRKALPLWIREGLEKLEKQKQKKNEEENEQKKSALNLSGSSTSIAGYDHGKVDSPVQSPNINNADEGNDEGDGNPQFSEGESDKSESEGPRGKGRKTKVVLPSHKRRHSSDEEDEEKTEEERQQELMVNIRKLLTEVLLTVTTEEMRGIAQEMYNEALKGPAQQLRHSGGLDALRGKGGFLGLGGYGSGSESETEENSAGERLYAAEDERKHRSADIDREERSQRSRSRTQADKHDSARESDEDHSETHKPSYRHSRKQRRHRSPSSSYDESSSSASTHEKSRRKKHRRRDKSASSSPKRRSKHRRRHGRKSRSKSRSPRKHKSSKKKRRSETESDSDSESRTPSKRRSSKHSGREYSPKEKKHKRRRRSPSSSPRYEKEGKKDRKR